MAKLCKLSTSKVVIVPSIDRLRDVTVPKGFLLCKPVMLEDMHRYGDPEKLSIKAIATGKRLLMDFEGGVGWVSEHQVALDLVSSIYHVESNLNLRNKAFELGALGAPRISFKILLNTDYDASAWKSLLRMLAAQALTIPMHVLDPRMVGAAFKAWYGLGKIFFERRELNATDTPGRVGQIIADVLRYTAATPVLILFNPATIHLVGVLKAPVYLAIITAKQLRHTIAPNTGVKEGTTKKAFQRACETLIGKAQDKARIGSMTANSLRELVDAICPRNQLDNIYHALKYSYLMQKGLYIKPNIISGGGRGVIRLSWEDAGCKERLVISASNEKTIDEIAACSKSGNRENGRIVFELGEGTTEEKIATLTTTLRKLFNSFYRRGVNGLAMHSLVAEEEAPLVPFRENKAEIRYVFLKKADGTTEYVADYVKSGSNSVTANIADGGEGVRTDEMLKELFPDEETESFKEELRSYASIRLEQLKAAVRKRGRPYRHPLKDDKPLLFSMDIGLVDMGLGVVPTPIEVNSIHIGLKGLRDIDQDGYETALAGYSRETQLYIDAKLGLESK